MVDIGTKNVSETDLTPRINILWSDLIIETEHLYKRGDRGQANLRNIDLYDFYIELRNGLVQFETFEEHENCP